MFSPVLPPLSLPGVGVKGESTGDFTVFVSGSFLFFSLLLDWEIARSRDFAKARHLADQSPRLPTKVNADRATNQLDQYRNMYFTPRRSGRKGNHSPAQLACIPLRRAVFLAKTQSRTSTLGCLVARTLLPDGKASKSEHGAVVAEHGNTGSAAQGGEIVASQERLGREMGRRRIWYTSYQRDILRLLHALFAFFGFECYI